MVTELAAVAADVGLLTCLRRRRGFKLHLLSGEELGTSRSQGWVRSRRACCEMQQADRERVCRSR